MLVYRLPYKLLLVFVVFFVIFAIPFMMVTHGGFTGLQEALESVEPLLPEQRALYSGYLIHMVEDLVFLSFYIFVLAFIFSLFMSRSILSSLKELHRGARSLKEGHFDVNIELSTTDEIGEVISAFNDMAEGLRRQNKELKRKDQYINAMVDPLWVVDADNVVVDVNPAFTQLFGYRRDEVLGSTIFDFLDEEAEKLMRRTFYSDDGQVPATYEISMISKTEGLIPVLLSVAPVESGDVHAGRIGIMKDFRREAALRASIRREKENTEAIMDSMTDHMLVIDRDFRVQRANMAARVSAGRDFTGEPCHAVFHGRKQHCFLLGEDCPVKTVFETGTSYRTVHRHVLDGGVRRSFEIVAYPIRDDNGRVSQAVEIMRDITERRRTEDEIQQRNRELETLNTLSKVLSRSIGSEDAFGEVIEMVASISGMDGGGLYVMDEMHRDLRLRFHKGFSRDFVQKIEVVKVGQDLPGKVAQSGDWLHSPDLTTDQRAEQSLLRHSGIKGYACVPVRGKEKLTGIFFIFGFSPHVFTPEQMRILAAVSDMMGISFENARLYEKMKDLYVLNRRRRADEQRNILSLSSMLSSTLELKDVLVPSAELIKSACLADLVLILEQREGERFHLLAASGGAFPEGELLVRAGTDSLEGRAVGLREPVVLSQLAAREDFCVDKRFTGYGNACSVPVAIGDRALGAITLYFKSSKEPLEEDIHFLQTVASVLAVALERARLYEREAVQRGMADTILESITDSVVTVNTQGKVISVNRSAEMLFALGEGEVIGKSIDDLFGQEFDNAELLYRMVGSYEDALTGKASRIEGTFHATGNRRIPVVVRSVPAHDNQGRIVGVVFALTDLSVELELEAMRTDLVRSVSHEFRTPLTAIIGLTEMVVDSEVTGEKAQEYLYTVLDESRRLSDMVALVLDAAKIEQGKDMLMEADVDLTALMRLVRESAEPLIEHKLARFTVSVDENIGTCRGDVEKLRQLVYNLVENSLTYSGEGCTVDVTVGRYDGGITITVVDNGWGIEPDDLEHIGEKFYRGRNALRTRGMGLGMFIAQNIAELHGGKLSVTSEAGKGTTVTVKLPLRRDG